MTNRDAAPRMDHGRHGRLGGEWRDVLVVERSLGGA
jgi:hypothetical protein